MSKTIAIVITVLTVLCCGLPGLAVICVGGLALMGTQMPEVMTGANATTQEVLLGSIFFLCVGLILLVIPVVAGFVSFRMVKPEEPVYVGEELPPTA
jgi:hypothetical protein